ncbi:hypothetical protein [Bradyrhizobium sp. UNPF46]|uniref:hypothetical protein n=1 Tax=Bradyrhizobium sp. UNPF46 TaxID=1141168 RepID=UPI0015F07E22|nr:hypothetical protein [Bradyrhizobium sp. UNPF46]
MHDVLPIVVLEVDISAWAVPMAIFFFGAPVKRKGLQLALEPLNGQGIAGYVPEP